MCLNINVLNFHGNRSCNPYRCWWCEFNPKAKRLANVKAERIVREDIFESRCNHNRFLFGSDRWPTSLLLFLSQLLLALDSNSISTPHILFFPFDFDAKCHFVRYAETLRCWLCCIIPPLNRYFSLIHRRSRSSSGYHRIMISHNNPTFSLFEACNTKSEP